MRKVVAGLYLSLDGVVESPEKWQYDLFDADLGANLAAHIAEEDAILLGRRTYQAWVNYWPTSTAEPYASHINNTPKYVVSTTLESVDWKNATLVKRPLAEEIDRLKHQPGKNIGVAGSPTLVQSLLARGLLDELTLMIFPVVVGRGKRFFENRSEPFRLALTGCHVTPSGVALLKYAPRRD